MRVPRCGEITYSLNTALTARVDGLVMNRTDRHPVRFVDDGYPEAQDYASNYRVLPKRHTSRMRPRSLRATLRLLRRRWATLLGTSGRRGSQTAGTRTPATLARCP